MASDNQGAELPPSKLGTQEYWDSVYERENGVFDETGDEGEIWFGEESVKKMVTWAYKHVPPTYAPEASGSGTSEEESGKGPSVLECGCGNATLLLSLLYPSPSSKHFSPSPTHHYDPSRFVGIDYSEASVELAGKVERVRRRKWVRGFRKAEELGRDNGGAGDVNGGGSGVDGGGVAEKDADTEDEDDDEDEDEDESDDESDEEDGPETNDNPTEPPNSSAPHPLFLTSNLLTQPLSSLTSSHLSIPSTGFDLVLDKGTFDALALSQEVVTDGPFGERGWAPSRVYGGMVGGMVKMGGYFLITSCNFTEAEIITRFTAPETGLEYHSRVQHPSFSFGGKSGTIVCTVGFKKVRKAECEA